MARRGPSALATLALAFLPWIPAARADEATPASPAGRLARHLLESPTLVGDPGGVRSRLEALGITPQLFFQQYLNWKPRGGAETGSSTGSDASYDALLLVDGEALFGWPGLEGLFHAKGQYDRSVNDDVGALSDPIDDADFDEPIYVDELWLQQSAFGGDVWLRAGFLEQQTVFDRNAYANSEDRQFANTYLDNNGIVPLPNGLGVTLLVRPLERLEVALGVADADNVPQRAGFDTFFDKVESLTWYGELAWATGLSSGGASLPGTVRAGVFLDGRKLVVFGRGDPASGDPDTRRGHLGVYLSADQRVTRESDDAAQGLGVFARFGWADETVNRIAWLWSVGLEYTGLLPGRDADVLGLGGYHAIGSDRYHDDVDGDFEGEGAIELYYRIAALPWLAVTPDFQYVIDPGGDRSAEDAVVLNLRFRVTF